MSQSSVNAVLQDHLGFIWMGTQDGLNRYDGHSFKVYRHIPNNPHSLTNNYITALYEDNAGNLWIGTESGLNRLIPSTGDLLHFKHHDSNPKSLSGDHITAVAEDKNGNIWVGTKNNGLNKINPSTGYATHYTNTNSKLPSNNINDLFVDNKGYLWIATLNGLAQYIVGKSEIIVHQHDRNKPNSISDNSVWCIAQDPQGYYWVGTSFGMNKMLFSNRTAAFSSYFVSDTAGIDEQVTVTDIMIDDNHTIWFGTTGNGLYRLFEDVYGTTKFTRFHNLHYSPSSLVDDHVYCITKDFSGNIWVGTRNGISRFDKIKQGFVHLKRDYDSENTLSDNTIWHIFPETSDIFWIGNRKGITRYDRLRNKFNNYNLPNDNPNRPDESSSFCFLKDSKGRYWSGTASGLLSLNFNIYNQLVSYRRIKYKDSKPEEDDPVVYHLYEDSKGRIWIATREGLSLYNAETGNYKFYQHNGSKSSLSNNVSRFIHEDNMGRIWVATANGLNLVQEVDDSVKFKVFKGSPSQPKMLDNVVLTTIWQDSSSNLWIGTYGAGVVKFNMKTHIMESFTQKSHGLVNDAVYGILGDEDGNLWISTNNGLSKFNPFTEEARNYDKKDGLQSNEFNIGAYSVTETGEMVFGGINGINFFRAENIHINQTPPKVLITNALVDNESVSAEGSYMQSPGLINKTIKLPYKKSKITIEFAALHFSLPEGNQFKYMLEGVDEDFIFTGTDHRASYTNLPPGEYTFKVFAANSDGVWTEDPATMRIVIASPYWRTTWFQFLMIAIGLSLAYGFYWMRVRDIRKQKIRLARTVDEKTKKVLEQKEEIEQQKELLLQEKNKVEQLLLNILPEETAEELKSKGKASARQYRRVSVMFTDFKGFTKIAEEIKPTELVARLDSYFIEFDKIIEKYNLEKIKTIGDSYMCAGGLPVRNRENPIYTVLAALEIQNYMLEQKNDDPTTWDLRIGINTGETIAGVIGTKRFAYDIWGSTVNVASRLEAACEPGKVNVSGDTFDFIEPYFECEYRGKIPAKNTGEIDMYYVNRIKPELSVNGKGLEPSPAFWEYINLHLFSSINYMKAERYIMKLLRENLSPALHYHSISHTIDVTESAERLALLEGVKGEDLFLLQTAATYHDAGFVEQYDNNEPVGARMAEEILPKYGYSDEQIKKIAELIHATKIPHAPENHLEEIICDADLDYLGRDDFHEIADRLRIELREHGKINSDRLWDEIQVKFLSNHKYFTQSAIKTRQSKKEKHIKEIKTRLKEDKYKD